MMNRTKHAYSPKMQTYDYVKDRDILDIPGTYTLVAVLDVPYREVGVYEFKMSMTYSFSSASTSMFYRWRVNGGVWYEFSSEPKDKTDSISADYYYPIEHTGGDFKVEVEMRKETAAGVLNVYFHDLVFERKG